MPDDLKISDIIVEHTDEEGKTIKVIIVLNETLSNNLGEILEIQGYRSHIKNMIELEKPKLMRSTNEPVIVNE